MPFLVEVLSFLMSRGPLPPGYFIPVLSAGLFHRFSPTGCLEAFRPALSLFENEIGRACSTNGGDEECI
jgi:hypothetical protein